MDACFYYGVNNNLSGSGECKVKGNQHLIEIIKRYIEQSPDKAISFYEYMKLCLYHPEYGYYMSGRSKIGRKGDFYTSSAIGGLMGEMLARYIMSQTDKMSPQSPVTLVEWGGGTGRLAKQLLDEFRRSAPKFYARLTFISVEKSMSHRMLQAEACKEHKQLMRWMTEEEWLEQGPWERTIVLSNELPDAFPVHRIEYQYGEPLEIYVEWDAAAEAFLEKRRKLSDEDLRVYLDRQPVAFQHGQQLEINMDALDWMGAISMSLGSGFLITIDYGDEARELYAPHRMKGTLMCYRNHTASDEPYAYPGEQDMTAHVNFSALKEAGERTGLETEGYMTQKQFLVENGILNLLQDHDATDPFSPAARRNRAIRQLLLSDQMSELFKVLVQKKGELR